MKLSDTVENQRSFPQSFGQKPGCGFPVIGIAGLITLSHGGSEAMTTGASTSTTSPSPKAFSPATATATRF